MATIRQRRPVVWGVRVYLGRDPITGRKRQRSQVVHGGTRAFAGQAGGSQVVVFVAKEGPYAGRVISAVVPDANQVAQWGLR